MSRAYRSSSNVAAGFDSHLRWVLLALILSVYCLVLGGALQLPASAQSTLIVKGDSYSTSEDRTLNVNAPGVLKNDRTTSGKLSATLQRKPENGTLKLNRNGSFTYTPDDNWSGTDSFVYRVSSGSSQSASATVQLRVRAVNDVPTARGDRYDMVQGTVLRVQPRGVLKNDDDVESGRLVSSLVSGVSHGRLTFRQDGSFVYTPRANHTGSDSFRYRATDSGGKSDVAVANISITPANKTPNAHDGDYDLLEDGSRNITLAATDPDSDELTYRVTESPDHGSLTGTAPNLTYTPDPDYNGEDSVTYTASDGNLSDEGRISLDVSPVNDEPSFDIPDDDLAVNEDAGEQTVQNFATEISRGPQNESGQSLAFEVTANTNTALFSGSPSISQNGTLTYTPAGDKFGTATITVRLGDDGGTADGGDDTSPEKQFVIAVNPVNDAPEVTVTNDGPVDEGESARITATVTDAEDDAITYTFDCDDDGTYEVGPQRGSETDCAFDDSGNQKVNVQVTDGTESGNGSTTVTVDNVAPTATLSSNGPRDEGQNVTVSFSGQSDPSQADTQAGFRYEYACDGTFEGDPAPNYGTASTEASFSSCDFGQNGTKTIAARIIDKDGGATTYTTDVTVNNVKPEVTLSGPVQVDESTTIERTYRFTVTDPGNDTFTVNSEYPKCGLNGTLVDGSLTTDADGGSFECIFPDGDATSDVEIRVTDSDGATDTDNQLVRVNVANAAPSIAIEGDATALEGETKTYTYTVDEPGDDPAPTITESCGTGATYTDTPADNSFDCTFPDGDGANGTTYEVEVTADDGEDIGNRTKEVTVSNIAPEATGAQPQTADEGVSKTFDLGSFTDPGADGPWNVTVDWGDGSTDTTFTATSTGDIADQSHTYSDDGDYTITVTVAEDGQDAPFDEATSDVAVSNVAPVADDQTVGTDEGMAKTITLTASDVDDDLLTFRITSLPTDGTLYEGSGTSGDEITQDDLNTDLSGNKVTYQPDDRAFFGDDSFEFTACDDANPPACDEDGATVSITVSQFNDPPEATDDTKTTDEDTLLVFPASDLTANDSAGPNEDAQTLTVTSVQNAANGTVSLDNGQITFTPNPNSNGPASFEYTVRDDGQTNGADDFKTDDGKVDVTVNPINDDPTANDDSFATDEDTALRISPSELLSNDTDVDGDTLTITSVSNVTNGTVSQQSGDIVFTPTADYNGPASFRYTISDGNGGSSTAAVNITVNPVNDPPDASNDSLTLDEDTPTVFDPRTNDAKGPANESGQTLTVSRITTPPSNGTVTLTNSGNDAGKIRYTPNANYNGSDSFAYEVCDDGTPSRCDTATVNVTVTAVNDAPVADDENFSGAFRAVGNTAFVSNDSDDGAPDPTGPQKTIQGDILAGDNDPDGNALAITAGTFDTNDGGRVELQSDGDFTFYPKAGTSCTDKSDYFDYTVTDGNTSVKPGTAGTDTGRATIAIEDCVWYVDDNATTNGDGRSHTPFKTLAGVNGANDADAPGQTIFLYAPLVTYVGNLALENDQTLLTQAHGLRVPDGSGQANSNVELVSGSPQSLVRIGGLTLASSNTAQGISPVAPSGTALSGTSVGNATINTVTGGLIRNESGKAVDISGGNLNMVFSSVTALNSTSDGIRLDNVSGTFTANGGEITNAGEQDIDITGDRSDDTLNFTYKGTVTDDTGTLVNVSGQNGGTKEFDGTISDGNDGDGNGITLSNNTGATTRFDGGLTLSTGANPAFTATGGGTVVVTDPANSENTIATTTATALNVANTNIGADNLTFRSIGVSGGSNGIILNNTGTSGGLKVTGDGTSAQNGSGGTIQNTSESGANLSGTSGVELRQMNFTNANSIDGGSAGLCDNATNSGCNGAIKLSGVTGFRMDNVVVNGAEEMGIRGVNVTNMDIVNSRITNAGDERHENGISVYGLYGSAASSRDSEIQNTTVSANGQADDTVFIRNNATGTAGQTDKLTVINSSFINPGSAAELGDGVHVSLRNASNFDTVVQNSTFTQNTLTNGADGVQVDAGDTSRSSVSITNNTFDGVGWNQAAVNLTGTGTSTTTYSVSNNPKITGGQSVGVNVISFGTASMMRGTVSNNTVNSTTTGNSSSIGIWIQTAANNNQSIARVTNNTVTGFATGISGYAREGNAQADLTVGGNTATAGGNFPIYGGEFYSGNEQGQNNRLCVNFAPNNNLDGTMSGITDYSIDQQSGSRLQFQGFTGNGTNPTDVENFIKTRDNQGNLTLVDTSLASGLNVANATCAMP